MNLSIYLSWQIVLQIAVSRLSVFNQSWYLFANFLDLIHSTPEYANFFLKLCELVVLILDHSSNLPTLDGKFFDFIEVFTKLLGYLFAKWDHLCVDPCSSFVHEIFELFYLTAEFFRTSHKQRALSPNFSYAVTHTFHAQGELTVVLYCFLDVTRHSLFLFCSKASSEKSSEIQTAYIWKSETAYHARDPYFELVNKVSDFGFAIHFEIYFGKSHLNVLNF